MPQVFFELGGIMWEMRPESDIIFGSLYALRVHIAVAEILREIKYTYLFAGEPGQENRPC
jgi:hypothetical protein